MANIEVFCFLEENYKDVVLATTVDDPYFIQDEIFNKFTQNRGGSFVVLVDLFLRNGYSFNRYCLMEFDGIGKHKTTIINPRQISDNIKKVVRSYLIDNPEVFEESALSVKTINFIKTQHRK